MGDSGEKHLSASSKGIKAETEEAKLLLPTKTWPGGVGEDADTLLLCAHIGRTVLRMEASH